MILNVQQMTSGRVNVSSNRVSDNNKLTQLITEVSALTEKQHSVVAEMNALKRENETVWGRYTNLQDKLAKQENVISKVCSTFNIDLPYSIETLILI